MWYLEVIGAESEETTPELLLKGIDESTLKAFLKKANPEYADEYFGPFSYEVVNVDALSDLAGYIEIWPNVPKGFQYCVTFYDD